MENLVQAYPFWNPAGAGEAERYAAPLPLTAILQAGILTDAQRLKVPQEDEYNSNYLPQWQYVPAFVPNPQSPFHVPDPYTQSRSLLDYARTTVGTAQSSITSARGTEGQANKTGK